MSRRIRQVLEVALALAVLVGAGSVFFNVKAKLDSDEVEWIGTTRFFQLYAVEHDVSPQSWPDEYWTRTQPMVVRYVIGGWLWQRGYDLKALDPTYDYTRNATINRRAGLTPSDALLADARAPARALAAISVLLLYLLVRVLGGPVGGIVGGLAAATLAVGSPYLQEHLGRAKAESTLMALLLAALLVGVLGLQRSAGERALVAGEAASDLSGGWPRISWGILTGVLLGLAFGAKLTAILAVAAVALWGAGACLVAGSPRRLLARWSGPWPRWAGGRSGLDAKIGYPRPWAWPAAALLMTGLVFLLSNPFLWPDPLGRTWLLFENRRKEMSDQQTNLPGRAVFTLDRRIELVWDRSLVNDAFGPSRLGQPVEAVLFVVGAGWLAVRAWTRRPTSLTLVFLWSASIWVGVTLGLGFLLQHYFVPTAMTTDLLAGLAVAWGAQALCRALVWLARRYRPSRHAAPPPPEPVAAR
jgi:hypothetical protein